jgi:hypothetical protein
MNMNGYNIIFDGEIIYLRNNKELYDFLLKDEGLK